MPPSNLLGEKITVLGNIDLDSFIVVDTEDLASHLCATKPTHFYYRYPTFRHLEDALEPRKSHKDVIFLFDAV